MNIFIERYLYFKLHVQFLPLSVNISMDSFSWTHNEIRLSAGWGTVMLTMLIMITITNILTVLTIKYMRRLQLQQYLILSLAIMDLVTVLPHLTAVVGYFKGYLV